MGVLLRRWDCLQRICYPADRKLPLLDGTGDFFQIVEPASIRAAKQANM